MILRKFATLTLVLLALAGCSHKSEERALSTAAAPSNPSGNVPEKRYLAYSRHVQLNTDADKIAGLYQKAQDLCNADSANHCHLLSARLDTSRHTYAHLTLRAKAAGIQALLKVLGQDASIASQELDAEDLGGPIVDTEKRIAMLQDYRERLIHLNAQPGQNLDSLIKLSKELADVQSDLETAQGKAAGLTEKVETERLDLDISSGDAASFSSPVADALSAFRSNLGNGLGVFLSSLAYLLPWMVFLMALLFVFKRLRRKAAAR
jgi:hypothetical protein